MLLCLFWFREIYEVQSGKLGLVASWEGCGHQIVLSWCVCGWSGN